MADINKVVLVGRVANDPKCEDKGTYKLCRLSVATTTQVKTRDGMKDEVCYIDMTVWNKEAERCGTLLRKGMPLTVEGRLKLEKFKDKMGNDREKHVIHPDLIKFEEAPQPSNDFDDEMPF